MKPVRRRLTIAIDFDGTIVDDDYPFIGEIKTGCAEALRELHDTGHYLVLNTCRSGERLVEAETFLLTSKLLNLFESINENHRLRCDMFGGDTRKISADVYIDEKNIGGIPPWSEIPGIIERLANETHCR